MMDGQRGKLGRNHGSDLSLLTIIINCIMHGTVLLVKECNYASAHQKLSFICYPVMHFSIYIHIIQGGPKKNAPNLNIDFSGTKISFIHLEKVCLEF